MPAFQPWKPHLIRRPLKLARRYEARLAQQNILAGQRPHSRQWLRLHLDYCHKYSSRQRIGGSLAAFREQQLKPLHLAAP